MSYSRLRRAIIFQFLQATAMMASLATFPVVSSAQTLSWDAIDPGDLLTGSNWVGGVAPNGLGQSADISSMPLNAGDFTLDGNMTLTNLYYSNASSRSISGSGTLHLDITTGTPEISVTDGSLSIETTVSGPQGLLKTGTGKLILSGTNTYTANTSISGGTLSGNTISERGVNSAFGATATGFTFTNGATLEYTGVSASTNRSFAMNSGGGNIDVTDAGTELTLTNNPSGSGGFTKTGAGILTLTISSPHTGLNTVSGGTLRGATLANNGSNSVFGQGNFALTNGGTLDYTGSTVSTNRTFTLNNGGGISVSRVSGSATLTLSGLVSGTGSFTKSGDRGLVLSATNNSYTGNTIITGGTLSGSTMANIGANSSFGQGNFEISNHARLQYAGPVTSTNRTFILGTGGGAIDVDNPANVLTLQGVVSGPGDFYIESEGTLQLNADNTYEGATQVRTGTLRLGGNERIPNNSAVTFDASGVLNLNNFSETIGSLSSPSATASVVLGSGTLTTGGDGTSTGFAGVISGSGGGLTKTGAGTMTLSGASNSYTGTNTISGGTLSGSTITNFNTSNSSFGRGNFALSNGGVFEYTGSSNDTNRTFALGTGGGVINIVGSSILDMNGVISGIGGLTKGSTGVIKLNAANSYSGGTVISGGTVSGNMLADEGVNSSFGQGSFVLSSSGTLEYTGNTSSTNRSVSLDGGGVISVTNPTSILTLTGALSGVGNFVKTGAGTLQLNAAPNYAGGTSVSQGTLRLGASERFADTGDIFLSSGATFDLNGFNETVSVVGGDGIIALSGGGNLTVGNSTVANAMFGTITGSGSLYKVGNNRLLLLGTNSYSGNTSVSCGTLSGNTIANIGSNSSFGQGNFSIGTVGTLEYTGLSASTNRSFTTLDGSGSITVLHAGTTLTLTRTVGFGAITGGNLIKSGAGTLRLEGTTSYEGYTSINDGSIQLGNHERIPDLSLVSVTSGATFDLNSFNETVGSLTGTGSILLGSGSLTAGGNGLTRSFTGVISGSGGLMKVGTGTLTLGPNNSYSGETTIAAGRLSGTTIANIDVDSSFGRGSISLSALATLQYTGDTTSTDRSIQLDVGIETLGNIEVTQIATKLTLAGDLTGSGGLRKTGAGTLNLATAGSYLSGTIVDDGTLAVSNFTDSATGPGPVIVNSGGTLTGEGSVSGHVEIHGGGILSPGNIVESLEVGMLTFHTGAALSLEVNNPTGLMGTLDGWDAVNVSGSIAFDALAEVEIDITSLASGDIVGTLDDFDPTTQYTWTFATAAGGIAGFENVTFLIDDAQFAAANGIPSGRFSVVQNTALSLALQFAPFEKGDFDFDGDVDGRDFLAWQRNPEIDDLADWQTNYDTPPSLATSLSVPEPTALIVFLSMAGGVSLGRIGSRSRSTT